MLNLFLIILIIMLILPQPLGKTIKKTLPFWGGVLAIALILFCVQRNTERRPSNALVVTALNEKNESSDGSEIWLTEVRVNGESHSPSEYFGDTWIKKNNALIWRSYDQKEGMPDSISAQFEPKTNVELVFQANRWRGKAQISCGEQKSSLDFYLDTDSSKEVKTVLFTIPEIDTEGYRITKDLPILMFAVLILLNLLYYTGYYMRNHQFPPVGGVDNREIWFDVLKVISSIMIVLIHSSGHIYGASFTQDSQLWIKALWVNAVPRFAVPCFLMITGALLLDKKYDFGKKLFQKIFRILIPLIVWSVIYIAARKLLWNRGDKLIKEVMKIPFINQDGALWYAYQLIWIYLGLPFWQSLYRHLNERMRWCFVIFSLGIPGILTMAGELSFLGVPEYLPFGSINAMVCYVGLLFLGKLWYERIAHTQMGLLCVQGICLIAAGLGLMILCSIYVSGRKGASVRTFFSEVRIPAVLYGSGVFLLLGSMKSMIQKLPRIVRKGIVSLSSVSLGVYFSHSLAIWIWPGMTIGGIWIYRDGESILQLLICVGVYYGMAAAGCWMMSHLPGLKRLVL